MSKLILRMGHGCDRDMVIFCQQGIVKACDGHIARHLSQIPAASG